MAKIETYGCKESLDALTQVREKKAKELIDFLDCFHDWTPVGKKGNNFLCTKCDIITQSTYSTGPPEQYHQDYEFMSEKLMEKGYKVELSSKGPEGHKFPFITVTNPTGDKQYITGTSEVPLNSTLADYLRVTVEKLMEELI